MIRTTVLSRHLVFDISYFLNTNRFSTDLPEMLSLRYKSFKMPFSKSNYKNNTISSVANLTESSF